jgi:hypothetical protein
MHVALVGGDTTMIRSVWNSLPAAVQVEGRLGFAMTAMRHQRREALQWLLCGLSTGDLAKVGVVAARERLAGGLLALADLDFDFGGSSVEVLAALAEWDSTFVLELVPLPELEVWTRLVFRAKTDGARRSLRVRSTHLAKDFVEWAFRTAAEGAAPVLKHLEGEFKRGRRKAVCWRWLLVCGKVESNLATCSAQVLAAWLAVGANPNAVSSRGELRSLLAVRASSGDVVAVKLLLLKGGASVECTRERVRRQLHEAELAPLPRASQLGVVGAGSRPGRMWTLCAKTELRFRSRRDRAT